MAALSCSLSTTAATWTGCAGGKMPQPCNEWCDAMHLTPIHHYPYTALFPPCPDCRHGAALGIGTSCAAGPVPSASGRLPNNAARRGTRQRVTVQHVTSHRSPAAFVCKRPSQCRAVLLSHGHSNRRQTAALHLRCCQSRALGPHRGASRELHGKPPEGRTKNGDLQTVCCVLDCRALHAS